jgi:hypothetical protein
MFTLLRFILAFQRKCQGIDTVDIDDIDVQEGSRDGHVTTDHIGDSAEMSVCTEMSRYRYSGY